MRAQRVQLKTTIDGQQVPLNPYTDCVKNVRQQMPLAGSKLLGTTVLYVGPTTDTYSTGVCYTCKATESSSYYWEAIASGGGDYTLTKEAVDGVIGASTAGSTAKFYNEQGDFTEVDMSGYLPLSGGTITGDLNITGSSVNINLNNGTDGTLGSFSVYVPLGLDQDYGTPNYHSIQMADTVATFKSTAGWQFRVIDSNTNTNTSYIRNYHSFMHIYNQNHVALAAGEDNEIMVSLKSDDRYERVAIKAPNGAVINDIPIATVDDIFTHNTDTTSHADLFALKVDIETYNTAITAINTALEGKENTGVAQGLMDAHATVTASSDTLGHIKVDNDTITVDENGVATAHAVGHNIFDIFYSMSSKAPTGAMDLSLGTLIASCDTVFPDFWNECVARKAEGSIRTITEEEWQAEATANGSCGAFVVDEDAKSVRLPKITNMIQPGDVGVFTEAGLPNINGQLLTRPPLANTTSGAGALYYGSNNTEGYSAPRGDASTTNQIYFDASKSNSIYGNSTTVQPPAVGAKLYIQVFISAVPASMAQAGEFINMLETKADKTELELLQPAGTVIAFAGNSAPAGYLICNGAAVSRTTYAKLFAVIGTTYGEGDGSTTFNLPNLTNKFIMGSGTAGTSKAAGLPNIEGAFVLRRGGSQGTASLRMASSGAFYADTTNTTTSAIIWNATSYSSAVIGTNFVFKASRSSSVYKDDITTVQPPALTMRFYIKY